MSQVRSLPFHGTRDRSPATPVALRRIAPASTSEAENAPHATSLSEPELPELIVHWGYPEPAVGSRNFPQTSQANRDSQPDTPPGQIAPAPTTSHQPHSQHHADTTPAPTAAILPTSDPVLEQITALRQVVRELQAEVAKSSEPTKLHEALLEHQARDAIRQLQQAVAQVTQEATRQVARLVEKELGKPSAAVPVSPQKQQRMAQDQPAQTHSDRRAPIAGSQGLRVIARPAVATFDSQPLAKPAMPTLPHNQPAPHAVTQRSSAIISNSNHSPIPSPALSLSGPDPSDDSDLFPTPTTLPWHLRVRDGSWWLAILWQAACVASVIGSVLAVPLWMSESNGTRDASSQRTYGSIDSQNQSGLPRARLVELLPDRSTRVAARPAAIPAAQPPAAANAKPTESAPDSATSLTASRRTDAMPEARDSASNPATAPRLVGPLDQAAADPSPSGARR